VFKLLCIQTANENSKEFVKTSANVFNARDVATILTKMELTFTRSEIDLMLWVSE
jgi:hypothetical protein